MLAKLQESWDFFSTLLGWVETNPWCSWKITSKRWYFLIGGLEHEFYFAFYIWDVIPTPLTNSYCSRWFFNHQAVFLVDFQSDFSQLTVVDRFRFSRFFFPLPDSGNQSTRSRGVAEQVPGTGYRGVTVSSNPWRWKTELLEGTYRDIPWEKSWWSYWILVEECSKAIGNIQNNGTSWDSIG